MCAMGGEMQPWVTCAAKYTGALLPISMAANVTKESIRSNDGDYMSPLKYGTFYLHRASRDTPFWGATGLLRMSHFENLAPPGVTSLELFIDDTRGSKVYVQYKNMARAQLFYNEIKCIFSDAQEVQVFYDGEDSSHAGYEFWHRLSTGLLLWKPLIDFHRAHFNPNFGHFAEPAKLCRPAMIELIHRNSETLEQLDIKEGKLANFPGFLVRDNGEPAVHSCVKLLDLELHVLSGGCGEKKLIHPCLDGVPFPALHHSVCMNGHSYGNDTILKGSTSIMEYLCIPALSVITDVLVQNGVAAAGHFPALRVVEVMSSDDIAPNNQCYFSDMDKDSCDDEYGGYVLDLWLAQLLISLEGTRSVKRNASLIDEDPKKLTCQSPGDIFGSPLWLIPRDGWGYYALKFGRDVLKYTTGALDSDGEPDEAVSDTSDDEESDDEDLDMAELCPLGGPCISDMPDALYTL
ncbi:hypothetical protein DL89DRAFT_300575 [Linderina pennispora]|uniref:Uncharacterized protein n=1 Tax=Linderina pennispora TaxID=61395 RepID=A0A1Y1WLJ0_9FUNG|nr:uncharacterized protein DL89DRAFT_300575 [Linderina pennispora]ORX74440.1 hypothetical protein DL89DRAFT_300575 [Linderina pennispora]